jgi:hypothetical protein
MQDLQLQMQALQAQQEPPASSGAEPPPAKWGEMLTPGMCPHGIPICQRWELTTVSLTMIWLS